MKNFLLEKVSAVLRDYGFDGWHLATDIITVGSNSAMRTIPTT